MRRWVALAVAVLLSVGLAACQQGVQPQAEEVEELTSKLASQDLELFLEALHPELLNHIDDEAVKEKLMAPEGSVVSMSDPVWSNSVGCWTTGITIEAPDDLVERTMCLVRIEGRWYVTNGNEVNEK